MGRVRTYPAAFLNDTYRLLDNFFEGDREKTNKWMNTPNPMLANIKPNDYIKDPDRWGRLYKIVFNSLKGNIP